MKKKVEETANMTWDTCPFKITADNMVLFETLCKYAQYIDFEVGIDDHLTPDGVLNDVLDDVLTKRIKELVKKHGFTDSEDFISSLDGCKDGEEVAAAIRDAEKMAQARIHERILAHVPIEDRQLKMF